MDVYYITGTSRGIGKALTETLLTHDHNRIFGMSRSQSISHERYEHIKLDLANEKEVVSFRFHPPPRAKRLFLINNAGIILPVAPVGRMDANALIRGYRVNLMSPTILINQFVRETKNRRAVRMVVNISSGAARHAIDSWSGYCAGKAGIDMFSKVLQSEQPIHNSKNPVRIYAIAPGVVDTNMQKNLRTTSKKDFAGKDRFVQMKKTGQLASPDQVAKSLIKIIDTPERFPDVCMDIRDL